MQYDLEERVFRYAHDVRAFIKNVPRSLSNNEDIRQLVRSSGSVGANYIEANEAVSKKDFILRLKISKKEAKESSFWLRLLDLGDAALLLKERTRLIQESKELMLITAAILRNSAG